jgi:hypothetical protein
MILVLSWLLIDLRVPRALSLDKEIYNTRAPYMLLMHISHVLENIDYLIHPLSFNQVKDEANHLLMSVNELVKP